MGSDASAGSRLAIRELVKNRQPGEYVSESSHNWHPTRPNCRIQPPNLPVCKRILTRRRPTAAASTESPLLLSGNRVVNDAGLSGRRRRNLAIQLGQALLAYRFGQLAFPHDDHPPSVGDQLGMLPFVAFAVAQ